MATIRPATILDVGRIRLLASASVNGVVTHQAMGNLAMQADVSGGADHTPGAATYQASGTLDLTAGIAGDAVRLHSASGSLAVTLSISGNDTLAPDWGANVVAGQFHDLSVGSAVDIDLDLLMTVSGDSYSVIRSSAQIDETLLPAGLSISGNRIVGTPTTAESRIVWMRAHRGTWEGASYWTNLQALSQVTHGIRFDTSQEIADGTRAGSEYPEEWGGNPGDTGIGGRAEYISHDTGEMITGNGAMKFTYPPGTNIDPVNGDDFSAADIRWGAHTKPVAWDTANSGWVSGETFVSMWAMRFNRNTCQYQVAKVGPDYSADEKFMNWSRIPSTPGGGSLVAEQLIMYLEAGGAPASFHYAPWAGNSEREDRQQASSHHGGTDRVWQPSIDNGANPLTGVSPGEVWKSTTDDQAWDAYDQERAQWGPFWQYEFTDPDGSWPDPIAGGFWPPYDEWFFVKQVIDVGDVGVQNTRRRIYFAHHGQDWVETHDETYFITDETTTPSVYYDLGETQGGAGGQSTAFEFQMTVALAFDAQNDADRPERTRHYDAYAWANADVTQAPKDLDGGTYRTADAMLTFRVNEMPSYISTLPNYSVRSLEGVYTPTNGNESLYDAMPAEWQTSDPGGSSSYRDVINAFSGGQGLPDQRAFIVHGGGHGDSANNGVYRFDLNGTSAPTGWTTEVVSAVSSVVAGADEYSDGRPTAVHSYDTMTYDKAGNRLYRMGGALYNTGGATSRAWRLDMSTNTWTHVANFSSPARPGQRTVLDPTTRRILLLKRSSTSTAQFFDIASETFGSVFAAFESGVDGTMYLDTRRDRAYVMGANRYFEVDWNSGGPVSGCSVTADTSFTPTGDTSIHSEVDAVGFVDLHPTDANLDRVWLLGGEDTGPGYTSVWEMSLVTHATTEHTLTFESGAGFNFESTNYQGSFERGVFIQEWGIIAMVTGSQEPVQIIRVPSYT